MFFGKKTNGHTAPVEQKEETHKKIRRIEIVAGKLVTEVFAGKYESLFKGRGIEFADFREYVPGDDVRSIDWNVTARSGRTFVKRNDEERELTLMLVVDVSGSLGFGSQTRSKRDLASEIGAVLAFSALRNNDKVGLILFSDTVHKYIPPKKGKKHALRLIQEIISPGNVGQGTDIAGALDFLNRIQKRRALVFLMSDFLGGSFDKQLKLTERRHDLSVFRLFDPREDDLPAVGRLRLRDLESGQMLVLDTSAPGFVAQYKKRRENERETMRRQFDAARVDHSDFSTTGSVTADLTRFFATKKARGRMRRAQ